MILRAVFVIYLMFCGVGEARAADHNATLQDDLNALIDQPSPEQIIVLVRIHKETLIITPDLASLAVIALRRSGLPDVAIALAERVRIEYGPHRRLDYERAVTYWSQGRCASAIPIFRRLNFHPGDDFISRESRLFLASCEAMARWQSDLFFSLNYDPNLGNTAPWREITAEKGSAYDRLLTSLSPLFEVPDTLQLGEKPVKGLRFGAHPGLIRHRHHEGGVDISRLGLDGRIANRKGYDDWRLRVNHQRWRQGGRFSTLSRFEFSHGTAHHGPGRPATTSNRLSTGLRYGFDLSSQFELSAEFQGRYREHTSPQPSHLQQIDQRFTIRHRVPAAGTDSFSRLFDWGWSVYLTRGEDSAKAATRRGSRSGWGLTLGPFVLGDNARFTVEAEVEKKRFHTARPWLREPHHDERRLIGITYTYPLGKDRSVDITVTHAEIRSPDPFDHGTNWDISLIFKY